MEFATISCWSMSPDSCYNKFDGGCLMIYVKISLMEDVS